MERLLDGIVIFFQPTGSVEMPGKQQQGRPVTASPASSLIE
ncbi:hypothetical protein [Desulfallas sp. Bu1-1]|nr:hypothetical protein [Desulfallas sp. Bu1-1]